MPALPGGQFDITIPRSSSSVRKSLHEDRLLDVTFSKASGPAVDPGKGGEEDPDQYSKPDTQHESGSEHSFHSQKSFDKFSFGNIFQTQPSKHKCNSNSHRSNSHHSNSSHGYNNSYAQSHASHSNGSHCALSVKSSVSDIISDKAESVPSVGSRNRGTGRLVTIGQSGSEGSEGKAYPGRETLEQIRSLGSLGGQSENESF